MLIFKIHVHLLGGTPSSFSMKVVKSFTICLFSSGPKFPIDSRDAMTPGRVEFPPMHI